MYAGRAESSWRAPSQSNKEATFCRKKRETRWKGRNTLLTIVGIDFNSSSKYGVGTTGCRQCLFDVISEERETTNAAGGATMTPIPRPPSPVAYYQQSYVNILPTGSRYLESTSPLWRFLASFFVPPWLDCRMIIVACRLHSTVSANYRRRKSSTSALLFLETQDCSETQTVCSARTNAHARVTSHKRLFLYLDALPQSRRQARAPPPSLRAPPLRHRRGRWTRAGWRTRGWCRKTVGFPPGFEGGGRGQRRVEDEVWDRREGAKHAALCAT